MTSRICSGDETAAWEDHGAGGAETGVVPPPVETVAAVELAWSSADDSGEEPPGCRSWRVAAGNALGLFLVCIAVAGAAVLVCRQLATTPHRFDGQVAGSVAPNAEPAAVPDTVAPETLPPAPEVAEHLQEPVAVPTDDDVYISRLARDGIPTRDREGTIKNGHILCQMLAAGKTDAGIVPVLLKDPTFTLPNAEDMISAAVAVYCPQYSNQLGNY
jgi:Protein of unknown function (DUF732)